MQEAGTQVPLAPGLWAQPGRGVTQPEGGALEGCKRHQLTCTFSRPFWLQLLVALWGSGSVPGACPTNLAARSLSSNAVVRSEGAEQRNPGGGVGPRPQAALLSALG